MSPTHTETIARLREERVALQAENEMLRQELRDARVGIIRPQRLGNRRELLAFIDEQKARQQIPSDAAIVRGAGVAHNTISAIRHQGKGTHHDVLVALVETLGHDLVALPKESTSA